MKKQQKKELLSKLKEISNLDRNHRFSQKVFRHLRTSNRSKEGSFHISQNLASDQSSPSNYDIMLSPPSTRMEPNFSNKSQDEMLFVENNTKKMYSKVKGKHLTQQSGRSFLNNLQNYSYKNQTTQRVPRFSKAKPDSNVNQSISNTSDFYQNIGQKSKGRCPQCIKKKILRDQKIDSMTSELKQLHSKLKKTEEKYNNLKAGIEPYINNVHLMSVIIGSVTEDGKSRLAQQSVQCIDDEALHQRNQLKETSNINKWLLKEGVQKQKKFTNQKYRLNCQLDTLAGENIELKRQISQKQQKIKQVEQKMKGLDVNHPLRQRLDMCGEELYTYKYKYQEKLKQNEDLHLHIQEMKYKLNVLTSLIGCAIIFDVHEQEKDKKHLKEILNKIDKYENLAHNRMDDNVFQYLKILKADEGEQENNKKPNKFNKFKHPSKRKTLQADNAKLPSIEQSQKKMPKKLYYPNYLVLLGEESISARAQHIVIKPALFIKIRSILDSKYIDYCLYETSASNFPQFCNSHIRNYDIQVGEKKPYYITRSLTENQIKEMNLEFIRCLLDERIQDIPEIQIFRDFLMGKYEEDQIYFYLMCRHKFTAGSQIQNYINSGDPSKFIKFDKAKRIVIKITQRFGRNIQNFICHHLNERKIIKTKHQFIRLYYLLKLLLLVYRKIRNKKIQEFGDLFNNILETTKKDRINFIQFNELLRKNFQFLSRSQICRMYQKSISIMQSQQRKVTFFECFAASCSSKLFLQELRKLDSKLTHQVQQQQLMMNFKSDPITQLQPKHTRQPIKPKCTNPKKSHNSSMNGSQYSISTHKSIQRMQSNQLNQLWPDSVYSLCNQRLTRQYFDLARANPFQLKTKIDSLQFLLNVATAHLVKQDIFLYHKEDLSNALYQAIQSLVKYLNKLENKKLEHENQINSASRKLGKFFKNKIYQFYHEMLQDINNIKTPNQKPHQKLGQPGPHTKTANMFTRMK